MPHSPTSNPAGITPQLPPAIYQLIHTLRLTLPAPLTDSPEDLARRDQFVIARIAELGPATALEADQAALYVASFEQWKECLRVAQQPETSPQWAMKCRAQANSMMRQSQGALSKLRRMQATRRETEADPEARDLAARTERCAINLMAEALSSPPAPPPPPSAPEPLLQPQPDPLAAAEQFAAIHPQSAALLRRLGHVPDNIPFDVPDHVLQTLLTARTPLFAKLDRQFADDPTA